MKKLFLVLTLLVPVVGHAQGFDNYGGSNDLSCTWPNAAFAVTNTSATRSSNSVTATVSSDPRAIFYVKEHVYVTGMNDSSFNSDLTKAASLQSAGTFQITALTASTIVYDQTGTNASATGGQIVAARWYTQQIGSRWWMCTPAGHAMFVTLVQFIGEDGPTDYQNVSVATLVDNKYNANVGPVSNPDCNWAYWTVKRLQNFGFNATGEFASFKTYPTNSTCSFTGDGSIPVKLPFVFLTRSHYGNCNVGALAPQPFKGFKGLFKTSFITTNPRPSMDFFDPNVATYMNAFVKDKTSSGPSSNGFIFENVHNDFLISLMTDDSDESGGFGAGQDYQTLTNGAIDTPPGKGDEHAGAMLLVTSPLQAGAISANQPCAGDWAYYDPKYYSKQEFTTWLQGSSDNGPNYASISALNTAWGSTYTSFGSTASSFTGESVGTGNGSATSFSITLAHTPATPLSLQILIAGVPVGGADGSGPVASSPTQTENLRSMNSNYVYGSWAATTPYIAGAIIKDSNSNIQMVKTAGTSGGSQPTWATALCATTTDSGVTWVNMSPGVTAASSILTDNTGALTVVFGSAPASGCAITANYQTGGWGSGTGILDEDGRHGWLPTNYITMTGGTLTAAFKTDMDNFLYHFAKKYASVMKAARDADYPNVLLNGFTGIGNWGAPPRAKVLAGMCPLLDVIGYVPDQTVSDAQARNDFFYTNCGNKPTLAWEGFDAQADSYFSVYAAPDTTSAKSATQAIRGTLYQTRMNNLLNLGSSNVFHNVMWMWWNIYDQRSESHNWGWMTPRDDAYDGLAATSNAGVDFLGFYAGCQGRDGGAGTWNCEQSCPTPSTCAGAPVAYGNFVYPAKQANIYWLNNITRTHVTGAMGGSNH